VSGWLVVDASPGRGNSVETGSGIIRVERGTDQQISIDLGHEGVSRDRAAEIAYDAKTKTFTLLRGTSVNLVYVNESAVYQPTPLAAGDIIQISATHLRFVPLCGPDFTWEDQSR
jgi:pSer/pThr/pTyr-binding forkhead associated (FHA) protein